MPAPPSERRRVLYYSHDGGGLGHLRITLGIANQFARRCHDAALLLLTGSLQTHAYELPPNLDYVKLPAMPKRPLYDGLPATPTTIPFKGVVFFRETVAYTTTTSFAPHLVIVDHAPAGLFREMARALETLRASPPRPQVILLMRDITFGPEQTRTIWHNEGVFDLLDRIYDRILVYGSQEIFDPIAEYGLSPAIAAKTTFCGYLEPPAPRRSPAAVRAALGVHDQRLAVVTVGGGADGAAIVRAFLAGLPGEAPDDLHAVVVTGPMLDEREQTKFAAIAAELPRVTLVPFDPDLVSVIGAADVVVTMGGYNALCEAVSAGKRPIVVPRAPGPEEQIIRARRFARRGLVRVVEPAELSPERLWAAIHTELARATSPPPLLPFTGTARIVDELVAALVPAASAAPRPDGYGPRAVSFPRVE
jgi:predicted glycosyltransferase